MEFRGWPVRDIGNNEYLQLGQNDDEINQKAEGFSAPKTCQKKQNLTWRNDAFFLKPKKKRWGLAKTDLETTLQDELGENDDFR